MTGRWPGKAKFHTGKNYKDITITSDRKHTWKVKDATIIPINL
jgi:hypothetical protein